MNLVTIENLTKQYGERVLLDEVDLLINENDRIGLLGRNGSGKTTLLRLVAGTETPDSGTVTVWGHVRIRYLSQKPQLDGTKTVLETVFDSDVPLMRLLRDYERTNRLLQQRPDDADLQQRFVELSAEMDRTAGWTAEAQGKTILTRLGITQFDDEIRILSGGQRRRVALAQALIDPGHLLVLDEPTNHIDADTVAWLEKFLGEMSAALLMVTHDRYFLENVVNQIVELNRRKLIAYPGSYTTYLEQQAEREKVLAAREEKRQAQLRRELEWLRRGARARSTKQKARKQRIEEMQEITYHKDNQRVAMALAGRRLGKQVLEAHGLSKAYGDNLLFEGVDFQLTKGDRIGIVGPNGAGKSTFLDVLAGKTEADEGQIEWGSTVELGYFDQRSEELLEHADEMVITYLEEIAPLITTKEGERINTPQMLEWFLFPRPEQRTKIGRLSGGERRRLYLLRVLTARPNVLFLDEPTNDLDVQTLNVLEEFLDSFEGTLVTVSHDRYFLDRNVDFIMSFEDGVLGTRYPSPYRPREQAQTETEPSPQKEKTAVPRRKKDDGPRKLTWKENRELEALDEKLPELEAKIAALETAVNNCGDDYQKLMALTEEMEQANAALETVMERWLELTEIAEASG